MHLCIFNPEHDLCLAKGRANYVPPRSAVEFAKRDAAIMREIYPDAECYSVYDEALRQRLPKATNITAWGWNAVVKWELMKRGAPEGLLPTDEEIESIRELQHRATVITLQRDTMAVVSEVEVERLLNKWDGHVVLKAPWSGAGRGIRWVHGALTEIDRGWIEKTVREQGMVMAERRRDVVADVALEYMLRGGEVSFVGYSLFSTGSGVYKENIMIGDAEIESRVSQLTWPMPQRLGDKRSMVEVWLDVLVAPTYEGPLGVDLMVDRNRNIYVAEMNVRHTMGMVAHAKINRQ